MKEKILKYLIFSLGFIGLYAFFAVRILPLFNTLVVEKLVPGYWDKTKYGELYYFNFINHFKEKNLPKAGIKHQYTENQPQVNDAEVFAFGDSFFDMVRPAQYPTVLAETLNKRVYFGYNDFPLQYLNKYGYKDTTPKVMVMGIVERFIPMKFLKQHDTSYIREEKRSEAFILGKKIKDFVFYKKGEELYDALLKRSYPTTTVYSEIATLKFDLFDYISRYTPVYWLGDTIPWLFHDNAVNDQNTSFYYQHSEEEIMIIANTLKDLSTKLKDLYNITFVFIPIPSKYTLYHTKFNNHRYNMFIPRLQKELTKRNVHFVDAFSHFMKADKLLYFGTDGHWNENGMRLAVDLTVNYLENNRLLIN